MKIESCRWTAVKGWQPNKPSPLGSRADLVFLFGGRENLAQKQLWVDMKRAYPKAHFVGCSTAGEIQQTNVIDDSLVATAVQFEKSSLNVARVQIGQTMNSFQAGAELATSLSKENLTHVMVFSDGLKVNGSELVKGLTENLPRHVAVTGGLAGDGARFKQTLVCADDVPEEGWLVAIGFYGSHLKVGYGSMGGWDSFGPERLITRSKNNVLYELEGKSVLALYKQYLGEAAAGLPATALLFPLSLRVPDQPSGLVRTILSVDEKEQSMTFAGDVPEGSYARFMKANFERLIEGANGSARISRQNGDSPDLAILISCVGRKLVLKQRIEEEVEAVREVLGNQTVLAGFYSYGEISPFTPNAKCELHNQTMTITTLSER
jgi:hypothetical protein